MSKIKYPVRVEANARGWAVYGTLDVQVAHAAVEEMLAESSPTPPERALARLREAPVTRWQGVVINTGTGRPAAMRSLAHADIRLDLVLVMFGEPIPAGALVWEVSADE